ncbi:uncharacterized protein [Temnothorax nylanderi]|uniref:uncharacterized protein n=1 Tax=Temnothorax nylanderi TaxID=102681 RepID=UPI003A869144
MLDSRGLTTHEIIYRVHTMPSCCISKCNNSSKKHYYMSRIPTDIERRNEWLNNIGRSDLDHSKIYFVCQVHFAPEMWERPRVDGKKKLKNCAIPTMCLPDKSTNVTEIGSNIDVNTETANKLEDKTNYEDFSDNVLAKDIEEIESTINIAESFTELTRNIHNEETESLISKVSTPISQAVIPVPLNTVDVEKVLEEADRKIQKVMEEADRKVQKAMLESRTAKLKVLRASKIINKLTKSKGMLVKRVRRLTCEKEKLIKEMCHLKQSKNLEQVFNDDQINTLCRPRGRVGRWSNDTIRKALRLKLSCGSSGYNEILKQNIPLPSERTLRRRLEGIDFEPGVGDQMFDILRERVSQFTDDRERDCMLALDEMSITAGEQSDQSTMTRIGLSTLPDRSGNYTAIYND